MPGATVDAVVGTQTRSELLPGSWSSPRAAQRYEALLAAQGIFAETGLRSAAYAFGAMTTGQIYFGAIGLAAGDVVTNLHTLCQVAGTSFSGVKMKAGLYTKAGVLLASTGDISAAHGTTGAKVNALTAPYTVPTSDGYYAALLAIFSGTAPQMAVTGVAMIGNGPFAGASMGEAGAQTGQTDLTAPATITHAAATAFRIWMGVS